MRRLEYGTPAGSTMRHPEGFSRSLPRFLQLALGEYWLSPTELVARNWKRYP